MKKARSLILTFVLFQAALFQAAGLAAAQTAAQTALVATPQPAATLNDLQLRIRERMMRPEAARGRIGIKIVSYNTGKVIFENDADKYFMPASNMKNFTVATGLEKLGPDFRFVTSVYALSAPDASGLVKSDLRVFGRGDISVSNSFFENDDLRGIENLVDRIAAAGVKRIEGDLIGDESYFKGFAIPQTWEWDDLQGYYGTVVSALPVNDNVIQLSVTPGPVGYSCTAKIAPLNPVFRVSNRCVTTAAGTRRQLQVTKLLHQDVIEIAGSMPAGDEGFRGPISVSRPAELYMAMLRQRLEARGIAVTGRVRTISGPMPARPCPTCADVQWTEIARLESPPFRTIAAKTMKPSQNMYTETILWTLGEQFGRPSNPNADSDRLGMDVVKQFLTSIGIPSDGIVQYDGSGLSRHDLITPSAVVALYSYMGKQSKYADAWRESLTIGGVDGTLRNRFKGTAAAGNIRGKTGTIDQVSALSGYMTTAGGEQLIVSIVVNGVPTPRDRTALIDDIIVNIANFTGKIDEQ